MTRLSRPTRLPRVMRHVTIAIILTRQGPMRQLLFPPQMSNLLLGMSGISDSGAPRDPRRGGTDALYEFEVCFKCHSYSPNKPQLPGYQTYGPLPNRQLLSTNLQLAFTSSASWHPVTRARGLSGGPGTALPSLLPAPLDGSGAPISGRTLSGSSQIYCTDCHANDSGRNLGSAYSEASGPHGSNVNHILERSYIVESPGGTPGNTANIPYSASNYALCFKCHNEQSLRNEESFKAHWKHMQISSCATCHDSHGVPNGTATNNGSLINFDLNLVAPNGNGVGPMWTDLTPSPGSTSFNGSCSLRCHNTDHDSKSY